MNPWLKFAVGIAAGVGAAAAAGQISKRSTAKEAAKSGGIGVAVPILATIALGALGGVKK